MTRSESSLEGEFCAISSEEISGNKKDVSTTFEIGPSLLRTRKTYLNEPVAFQLENTKNRLECFFSSCVVCERSFESQNQLAQNFDAFPFKKMVKDNLGAEKYFKYNLCNSNFISKHDLESREKRKTHHAALRPSS